MSFSKEIAVDQITVTENGTVLYREVTRIFEDGLELTKKYHRASLEPGQELDGVPENVVAICNTVWTPKVIELFNASKDSSSSSTNV